MFLWGWIVPVGDVIPDRREICQAALGETHSQAELGNDKVGAGLGNDRVGAAIGNDRDDRGLRFFQKNLGGGGGERVELRDYDTHILHTHIRAFLRAHIAHTSAHTSAHGSANDSPLVGILMGAPMIGQ